MPVLIIGTYNEDGTANVMNAAWSGISEENEISICVSEDHKTTENILKRKAFTVSMATADYVAECDYFGIATGNKVSSKVEKAGMTTQKSEYVDAPIICQLPMALECKLKSYDPVSCHLVGEILNVCAEESVLNEKGNIDVGQLKPITYDPSNHDYIVLGEIVGRAFSDGKTYKI